MITVDSCFKATKIHNTQSSSCFNVLSGVGGFASAYAVRLWQHIAIRNNHLNTEKFQCINLSMIPFQVALLPTQSYMSSCKVPKLRGALTNVLSGVGGFASAYAVRLL